MLKRLFILVLLLAVGVMGLPPIGMASQHSHATMAMENCDCPPAQDVPCQDSGGCDQMPGCALHCAAAPIGVPSSMALPFMPIAERGPRLNNVPGILLSSTYPPYRPPQV